MARKRATEETVVLRALASPMRQEILEVLGRGSATSAMLARTLASNTGVMSYHLRELGGAKIIERDEDRSRGREIYWRLGRWDVRFNDPATSDQPVLARAAIEMIMANLTASVRSYVGRGDLEPDWHDASLFSRSVTRLTVEELAAFNGEYLALLRRWTKRRKVPADARPIRLAMFAYPDDEPTTATD